MENKTIKIAALQGAVLTREALKQKLRHPEDDYRLVISPILDPRQLGDGSIDISLGTTFIVAHKPQLSQIDPTELKPQTIRRFQHPLTISFDGKFTLHPGSLVLGCTFEFIRLPLDLCGFVLSRSNYGRAGLLIATATYIHPGWQGCLTLELENLGEVPIVLRPGDRVGQLVFLAAMPLPQKPKLKSIPVLPAFSSLADEHRARRLRGRR